MQKETVQMDGLQKAVIIKNIDRCFAVKHPPHFLDVFDDDFLNNFFGASAVSVTCGCTQMLSHIPVALYDHSFQISPLAIFFSRWDIDVNTPLADFFQ